jgi:hypothetical protein
MANKAFKSDVGDIVVLRNIHFVVESCRRVTKGRHCGMFKRTFAPLEGMRGKSYGMHGTGDHFLSAPTKKFTAKQIQDALNTYRGVVQKIEEEKEERAEVNREIAGDIDYNSMQRKYVQKKSDWKDPDGLRSMLAIGTEKFKPGDKVTIRYTDCIQDEEFVSFNYKTGKIAIKRPWKKTGVRWLDAKLVIAVNGEKIS